VTEGADEAVEPGGAPRIGLVGGWSFSAAMFNPLLGYRSDASFDVYDWHSFAQTWLAPCGQATGLSPDAGPGVWLGWSLGGGLLLEALARDRIRPKRLILISATPRFLAEAGWPGVSRAEWRALRQAARRQPQAAAQAFRRRFSLGDADAFPVENSADVVGLDWLADIDARGLLASTSVPIEVWLAADDPLIPAGWADSLPLSPAVTVRRLSRPGHGALFACWAELADRLA